jgi:two-component system response regulator
MLDLKLPKVDGLQVLEVLRGDPHTQKLPIVILTSSDEQTDKLKSYGLGANSYVRKPIDFADFCEAVAQLGIYWTMLNEPLE